MKKKSNHSPGTLGEALRLFRVFHDLSVSELAKRLEVSSGYISLVEHGHKTPNLDLIARYAAIFETTSASILFFSEELASSRVPPGVSSKLRLGFVKFMKAVENAKG